VPSYWKESWIEKISSRKRLKTPFALNKALGHTKARKIFWTMMEFYTSAALTVTTS